MFVDDTPKVTHATTRSMHVEKQSATLTPAYIHIQSAKNFLKLCKVKYYNNCLVHNVEKDFISRMTQFLNVPVLPCAINVPRLVKKTGLIKKSAAYLVPPHRV